MVKFTTILLSIGNDQEFISDQLGVSLNWMKHVDTVFFSVNDIWCLQSMSAETEKVFA